MKFVLISFIYFTSLHYVLSQYDIYSQILRPYNSYRYAQPTFRYPQLTAVSYLQSTANRYPQSTADRYPKFTAVRYLPSTADRYLKPTADRYLKPIAESYSQSTVDSSPQPTVFRYSSYKSFTPKGRSLVITKKADVDQMQSHLDNLLSRMKSTMMQMNSKQEQSASDQSSKTVEDPNGTIYKGKLTRKTLASNRSASVNVINIFYGNKKLYEKKTILRMKIFYVTGVSVSWSSPSKRYSSINSQLVPTYNGNLQQESTSSTIQPLGISGSSLSSQIDNLNTKMSSNIGLGKNSNMIFVKQVGQRKDNNDDRVSENIITYIRPSEINSESSLSSTTNPNFEIPVHINGSGLSNIYHETNKISDINQFNKVNNLERSSGTDESFQLGKFSGLSGSINENGLNLVDNTGGSNESNEKGLSKESGDKIIENETYGVGKEDNYRRGHKSRKINFVSGTGGSTKFNFDAENLAKQGFVGKGVIREFGELSKDGGDRIFIENGEDKKLGRDRGFSASVGSIQLGRKNYGRASGSGGKKEGDRGLSRFNGSIRFNRKNKIGISRLGGEEEGNIGIGRSNGSIRFGSKIKGRGGGSGGEKEEEAKGFSKSIGSIRVSRQNSGRTVGLDGEEGGDRALSRFNGSIRFNRKNKIGISRLSGEEEGNNGVGGSNGSISFSRGDGSGGEEEEEEKGKGFSGSVGSIRLSRKNKSGTGGSGEENINFSEGQRTHKNSIFRGVGKMNGSGGTFGGSFGSLTFGEKSGDKEQSKSNSININRTVDNYGGGNFYSDIKGDQFSREYSTGKESDGAEFRPEMGEKLRQPGKENGKTALDGKDTDLKQLSEAERRFSYGRKQINL
ncbi:hypothetical protein QTP88_016090 [Uroleucon formosanum]